MDLNKLLSLAEEVKCPLCLDYFTQPRVLPCQHSFCTDCLSRYFASKTNKSKLPCPICRQEANMDAVGNNIKNLAINLVLANIVEHLRLNNITPTMSPKISRHNTSKITQKEEERQFPPFSSGVDYSFSAIRRSPPQTEENEPQFRYIAPLQIDESKAGKIFKNWVDGLWFAPTCLKDNADGLMVKCELQLLPFYIVECSIHSNYELVAISGSDDLVIERNEDNSYTQLVCCSSDSNIGKLAVDIKDWNPYLATPTASTDKLNEPLSIAKAWEFGKVEDCIFSSEEERITVALQDSNIKSKSTKLSLKFADISYTLVYLPAYVNTYKYNTTTYKVLISGQSGAITGQRPYGIGGSAKQCVNRLKNWFTVAAC